MPIKQQILTKKPLTMANEIVFTLQRKKQGTSSTLGEFLTPDDKKHICFSLEDEKREVKVMAETRIPAGKFLMTLIHYGKHDAQYKEKFKDMPDFHKGIILLNNVPNFSSILIHIGNSEADTAGCLLTGLDYTFVANNFTLIHSTTAYKRLYPLIRDAILSGTPTFIDVKDEVPENE